MWFFICGSERHGFPSPSGTYPTDYSPAFVTSLPALHERTVLRHLGFSSTSPRALHQTLLTTPRSNFFLDLYNPKGVFTEEATLIAVF